MKTGLLSLCGVIASSMLFAPVAYAAKPAEASELRPAAPFIREGSNNQNPTVGKLRGRLLRIKRPLLIVGDLERSIKFYVDLVGLELYSVEPTFDRRPESLGYELFNIDAGSRKRMAMLNTSTEVRGMTLQEVRDMQWSVQQKPRTSTILFETDDLIATVERVRAAGYQVVEPVAGEVPASLGVPALRFIEGGVSDPDGQVISVFQYFADDDEWRASKAKLSH